MTIEIGWRLLGAIVVVVAICVCATFAPTNRPER